MKLAQWFARIFIPALAIVSPVSLLSSHAQSEPDAVTIVLPTEPESLDPDRVVSLIEGQIMSRNIVEPLTDLNIADGSILPRLATSWKQLDENTWRFDLRHGVKFHDGTDLNADAVAHSIKRLYSEAKKSATGAKYFSSVKLEGIPVDEFTVDIKTDKFEPLLPTLMTFMPVTSLNVPVDEATRSPIGTGPYKFVQWDAGTRVVVERFDDYWGEAPKVRKATYVWREESAVRTTMVDIGEADLAPDIAFQDVNPETDKSYLNGNSIFLFITGREETNSPFNDKRIRLALNYAIDRDAMRGTIYPKDVILAAQPIVQGTLGFNPSIEPWPFDPEKAKEMIAEARKDGVDVDREIIVANRIGYFPGSDEMMEAITGMLRDVGFNAKLVSVETGVFRATYSNKPFPEGQILVVLRSHDNRTGDAGFSAFDLLHCDGRAARVCDKTISDLIDKAQRTIGDERRDLWQAVFARAHEEVIDIPLFHMVAYCRVGKRINYTPTVATGTEVQLAQITFN